MTSISPLWLTSFDWWKAVFFFIADRNLGLSSSVRWTDPADWLGLLTNQTKEKSQNQNGRKEKKGPTLFRFFLHWRQCDCDVIAHLLTSRSVAELVAVRKKKKKNVSQEGPTGLSARFRSVHQRWRNEKTTQRHPLSNDVTTISRWKGKPNWDSVHR